MTISLFCLFARSPRKRNPRRDKTRLKKLIQIWRQAGREWRGGAMPGSSICSREDESLNGGWTASWAGHQSNACVHYWNYECYHIWWLISSQQSCHCKPREIEREKEREGRIEGQTVSRGASLCVCMMSLFLANLCHGRAWRSVFLTCVTL